ncbi:MAG: TolC family protein [Desulfobacterales bacterium]|nr:TolC family protein [Desulfobacterales bacterium]
MIGKKSFGKIINRTELKKALFVFLCVFCGILTLNGCYWQAPSDAELDDIRRTSAEKDVRESKPRPGLHKFDETPLTLEDCIRIGLTNNLEMRIRFLQEEVQKKETLVHRLQMLPGLNANAKYEYRDKLRKSDVYNWETDEDQRDTTVSQLKDGTEANLSLTWNVLDTVMAYTRSGKSTLQEKAYDKQRIRYAQQLALEITEAYWQAAAVEDALDHVHTVERRLKDIKAKIDSSVRTGDLDRMDAREAELRLKELELTIRQLQANLSRSRLELSRLMGFNQNVQYTLARPPIKPIVAGLPHTKSLDIDKLEEYALTHRPDLFESDLNVLMQKQEAKLAFLRLFPGVNIFAGSHYDSNRLLHSSMWNSVGAGIGMDLLNLPSAYVALKAHEKTLDMTEAQRLLMTVGVITQVHLALLDYAIKVDRFRLLEDTYIISADLLKMAREKNAVGRLPELAVTQRHLEEMAAKLRRDESVVDLLVAHKRLCVSIGIDPLNCDASFVAGDGQTIGYSDATASYTDTSGVGTASGNFTEDDLNGTKRWKCPNCGYIHAGSAPPESCPICGTPGSKFKKYSGDELSDWMSTQPVTSDSRREPTRTLYAEGKPDRFATDASNRFLWKVQAGAFTKPGGPAGRLGQIKALNMRLTDSRDADVETVNLSRHGLVNRVRFKGLTQADAKKMADELKKKGMEYWIIPPHSAHW